MKIRDLDETAEIAELEKYEYEEEQRQQEISSLKTKVENLNADLREQKSVGNLDDQEEEIYRQFVIAGTEIAIENLTAAYRKLQSYSFREGLRKMIRAEIRKQLRLMFYQN